MREISLKSRKAAVNAKMRQLFLGALVSAGAGTVLAAAPVQAPQSEAGVPLFPLAVTIVLAVLAAVAGVLLMRKLARRPVHSPEPELALAGAMATGPQEKVAEEDIARFLMQFRSGPPSASPILPPVVAPSASPKAAPPTGARTEDESESSRDELGECFAWATGEVGVMRKLLERSVHTENQKAVRDLLVEIGERIVGLKHRAGRPEMRPAWQLATALEGLLKQLGGRAGNINHSTLRTINGGLELLGDLCQPGVRTDLASNPPIKILAVDDDPVSRYALSAALRRTFDTPDLAETGKAALVQVNQCRYDLIILDVVMPEMDGFEVCGKIRETAANATTPVLFVTALSDFDARTRSLATGGNDLLGKPFIAFEITVKALTLAFRARLRDKTRIGLACGGAADSGLPSVRWPAFGSAAQGEEAAGAGTRPAEKAGAKEVELLPPPPFLMPAVTGDEVPGAPPGAPLQFSPAFLKFMDGFLQDVKHQVALLCPMDDGPARQEMLGRLHMRLQSLSRRINLPDLRPVFGVCCVVEGLCKKLKNDPQKVTVSALHTAVTGLELLRDLCAPEVSPGLADDPPMRILVVDDEPVARRALVGALQMAFPRPDGADGAEAALAMTAEKEYDLIFLDVCMPEMNGFTACARIHETVPNRATPVVFVTSHSDVEFRAQADRCGARDFVVKPFDYIEIPVKALTHALRGRLEKLKATPAAAATVST